MPTKTICACGICLLFGLAIGRWMIPVTDVVTTSEEKSAADTSTKDLRNRGSQRKQSRTARILDVPRSSPNSEELAEQSGLSDPNKDGLLVVVPASMIGGMSRAKGVRSLGQDLFSRDGEIEKYLQISDGEKRQVQQAWRATRKQLRQIESDAAKAEDLPDGSVKITVPDMTIAMKGVGDEFSLGLQKVLGENRANAFRQMKQTDRVLNPVEGDRVYTVKVESAGDGRWRYHMSYQDAEGRKVWVGENIPAEIRHITHAAKINPELNPKEEGEGRGRGKRERVNKRKC